MVTWEVTIEESIDLQYIWTQVKTITSDPLLNNFSWRFDSPNVELFEWLNNWYLPLKHVCFPFSVASIDPLQHSNIMKTLVKEEKHAEKSICSQHTTIDFICTTIFEDDYSRCKSAYKLIAAMTSTCHKIKMQTNSRQNCHFCFLLTLLSLASPISIPTIFHSKRMPVSLLGSSEVML